MFAPCKQASQAEKDAEDEYESRSGFQRILNCERIYEYMCPFLGTDLDCFPFAENDCRKLAERLRGAVGCRI